MKAAVGSYLARLWATDSGRPIGGPLPHTGRIKSVGFSPDGRVCATGAGRPSKTKLPGGEVRLWLTETASPMGPPLEHPEPVWSIAFSPDGRTLVTACVDAYARLWSAATGQLLETSEHHEGNVRTVTFSPDGEWVLSGSAGGNRRDYARVWRVPHGQAHGVPLVHSSGVRRLTLSADGKVLLTWCSDKSAWLWDGATGSPLKAPLARGIEHVALSRDGQMVLGGGDRNVDRPWGSVRLWQTRSGKSQVGPSRWYFPVRCVCLSQDGQTFFTATDERFNFARWSTSTMELMGPTLPHLRSYCHSMASRSDGLLLTGEGARKEGWARVLDTRTGRVVREWQTSQAIFAVAFSPKDPDLVLVGGRDRSAQLLSLATGKRVLPPLLHNDAVSGVAFSKDGNTILTGSHDRAARLWDAVTGKPLGPPLRHGQEVGGVAFRPDGKWVIAGDHGGIAPFWEVPEPFIGDCTRARLWAECLTGMRRDAEGDCLVMTREDWVAELQALAPGIWPAAAVSKFLILTAVSSGRVRRNGRASGAYRSPPRFFLTL